MCQGKSFKLILFYFTENFHFYSEAGAIFIALPVSHSRKCGSQPLVPHLSHSNLWCLLLGAEIFQNFSQVNIYN
jgi:hypothetical protein